MAVLTVLVAAAPTNGSGLTGDPVPDEPEDGKGASGATGAEGAIGTVALAA